MENDTISQSLLRLKDYAERHNYAGYDLYDGLNITNSSFLLNNNLTNTIITQFFKLIPVNLRPLFKMKETRMPKAMGIFLNAYVNLAKNSCTTSSQEEYLDKSKQLFNWLVEASLENYSGCCWNFGFNYKLMSDQPTVVITSIIAKGLFNYYQLTKDKEAKNILLSITDFILKDLYITETTAGICFSYTPIKKDCCYNASMLASEILSKVFSITRQSDLLPVIEKAVDFTIAHQKDDGRWNYSIDIETGKERVQVDFHQGYILESLDEIIRYTGLNSNKYTNALKKGAEFYRNKQFFENGRSKWRLPRVYPVDIHNQAQGIITFSRFSDLNPEYPKFANKIAGWTIDHMQDKNGYFYFRKNRFYMNKISYMRWSNAWMFLALTMILGKI